jgi:hypothetical protein
MIEETSIPNWNNLPVPIKDKVQYPQCKDCESGGAPQNFFVSIFCGSRGTGKSYQLSKMLKTIEEKGTYTAEGQKIDNRILLISPTSFSPSNNCFKCLEGLNWEKDVMDDYDEDVFKKKIDEIKKDQDEAKEYQEYCRCYKIFESISDVNKMKVPDMMKLYAKDYQHPDELEKIPKYKNGFITTIILDDLLGTKAFKLGRNYLVNCIIRNRHTAGGINFCIAVQAINSVPKNVRLNANFISMFKFANKQSVINDIMPNLSAWVSEEELMELYDYATEKPHSSLIADMTRGKPIFKQNFDKLINLKKISNPIVEDGKQSSDK